MDYQLKLQSSVVRADFSKHHLYHPLTMTIQCRFTSRALVMWADDIATNTEEDDSASLPKSNLITMELAFFNVVSSNFAGYASWH